jgi:predicted Zn-dependent peptidase
MLIAQIETYPADAETVRLEALKVAGRLAGGEISVAQLEAARRPALAARAADLQTNAVWADQLAGTSRFKTKPKDLQFHPQEAADISLDEVRAVAARWLASAPIQVVVTPARKEAP